MLDGDLQNEPNDIPRMLEQLDGGFDLVHGWRRDRQDTLLTRKIPSRIANWLISKVTRFPIHDLGCTLKLFGRIGFAFLASGSAMLAATILMKVLGGWDMTGNPLLVMGAMLCIVSVQLFSVGLLGEANTRLYYRRNERRPFTIRSIVGGDTTAKEDIETLPLRRAA